MKKITHKHIWHLLEEASKGYGLYTYYWFVCDCGKVKKVLAK